ncbi:23S rRNA (uracil(1939)-C(5))-methyltransferase RlmD [Catalinimonas niigatensis]|nr:23S rRNA (uracil(1939)-C(5))-methyltransferase RlmD [Catalinimonas niigatensis]WPP53649.1 23S rRNA (uracil(1939)-C(5))-methyltransferase RlmD [Catalinimonas niigatensis]
MGNRKNIVLKEIRIDRMAAEGKCIAHHEDMVIFVKDVAPGDVVDLKVTKKKKSFMEAKPIHFHQLSSIRTEPFCSHFGICGGCKWQHIPYELQLQYKQQQVVDNFERIGKAPIGEMLPIIPSEETTYYRNKLEYTFSTHRWLTREEIGSGADFDRRALGFHIPQSFEKIIPIVHCYLQPDPSNAIRLALDEFARTHDIPFYDPVNHVGMLRNLIIRTSNTQEVMVIVQFGGEAANHPEKVRQVMQFLQESFPEITSLQYIINPKKNDTYFDLPVELYHGIPHITEKMEDLMFRISPKAFYQTNAQQAYQLYKLARSFANLQGDEVVYDLYTGTGTIANFIARQARQVVGIEYVEDAIEDAKVNAKINDITNSLFYAGDIKEVLNEQFLATHERPDVVITDPPRNGMHPDVVQKLLELQASRIVYVSCNPATQARDVAMLGQKYDVIKLQPVDMFPHTHHVENVALLSLRDVIP